MEKGRSGGLGACGFSVAPRHSQDPRHGASPSTCGDALRGFATFFQDDIDADACEAGEGKYWSRNDRRPNRNAHLCPPGCSRSPHYFPDPLCLLVTPACKPNSSPCGFPTPGRRERWSGKDDAEDEIDALAEDRPPAVARDRSRDARLKVRPFAAPAHVDCSPLPRPPGRWIRTVAHSGEVRGSAFCDRDQRGGSAAALPTTHPEAMSMTVAR